MSAPRHYRNLTCGKVDRTQTSDSALLFLPERRETDDLNIVHCSIGFDVDEKRVIRSQKLVTSINIVGEDEVSTQVKCDIMQEQECNKLFSGRRSVNFRIVAILDPPLEFFLRDF